MKRYWQSTTNRRVIACFETPLDNLSMEEHPEYIEVKQDGTPISKKPKSEQREDWEFPATRVVAAGKPEKKGKK